MISSCLACVYALMARAEEPWLEKTYGPAYERYKKRVPRFYNWRAIRLALQLEMTRATRTLSAG